MAEWDVIRREPAPAQAPQQNAADDGWAVVQRAPARGPDFSDPASVSASLIGSQPYDTPAPAARENPGFFSNLMDVGARGLVGLGSTFADAIRLPATANEAATRAIGMEPAESGTIASAMRGSLRSIADAVDPQWLIDDLDKVGVGAGTRDLGDFTDAIDPWSGQRMGARAETIARIVPEVLAGSVGEMVSSVNPLSMTAMILGKAEDNAQTRAENDKREDPTLTDVGLGGAAGAIEMLLERYTTSRFPQLLRGPGNAAPGVLPAVGRVARETGIQSGLGGLEELAPYLATTVGTEKGANVREAVGTFGLGALAEGVLGGAMSAGGEIANPVAAPAPAERIEPSWRIDPETGALDIDIVGGTPEPEAPLAAEPSPAPAPQQRSMADVGQIIDARLEALEAAAGARLSDEELAALQREQRELETLVREQDSLTASGVMGMPDSRLTPEERGVADQRRAEIRQQIEAHRAAIGYGNELAKLRERLSKIDNDNDLRALSERLAPSSAPGVQSTTQQSAASAMMGESDVQVEDQAEGQARREAGPRRQAEEGVQEEVTPAATMAAGVDLSPRAPAPATLTGGETREQILEEIAGARTADERARHAGRLAEYDARVRGAEAGPVDADGQAGARAAQEGLPAASRGAVEPQATPRSQAIDLALTRSLVANERRAARAEGRPAEDVAPVTGTLEVVPDGGNNEGSEGLSRAIREAFGVDTAFFRASDPRWEGYNALTRVRGHENTIFINEASSSPFLSAAAHELTHEIKTRDQRLYDRLDERLREAGANVELFMQEFLGPLMESNNETPFDATDPIAREELYAETGQALFKDKPFLEQLRRTDPGLLNDLVNKAIEWIDGVLSKLRASQKDIDVSRYYNDLQAVRDAFAEYYAGAARSRQGGRAAADGDVVAQRAFHGTPHRGIERFSLDRVGSGEGNQAYGWGLYFASMREVADHYRTNLSKSIPTSVSWRGRNYRGGTPRDSVTQALSHVLKAATENPRDNAVGAVRRALGRLDIASMGWDHPVVRALQDMQSSAPTINRNSNGALYAVEIPEDSDLLDHDAPLSQQPDRVRDAVIGVMNDILPSRRAARLIDDDASGGKIYHELSREIAGDEDSNSESTNDRAASEALDAAGIPGLRYLDGVSRRDGDGSRNYVIWNEEFISEPDAIIASRATGQVRQSRRRKAAPAELSSVPMFADFAAAKAKLGLAPGANKAREIALALNKAATPIAVTDRSPEVVDRLSAAMADEVRHGLGVTDEATGSGVGWYSNNYPTALKRLASRYPELANDEHARGMFTALLAITSNGEKVRRNLTMADQLYAKWRTGGDISQGLPGTRRADALAENIAILQQLEERFGYEGVRDHLLEEMTVKEINAELRARGEKPSSSYTADMRLPRAALYFGPKLGAFYANLAGADGYLTMDLWWTRSFNRYRGNLIPQPTASGVARVRGLLGLPDTATEQQVVDGAIPHWESYAARNYKNGTELEKAANTLIKAAMLEINEAPESASDRRFMYEVATAAQEKLAAGGVMVSIADIQAALWYYEKRLYSGLGVRVRDDIGYEEAINEWADEGDRTVGSFARGRGAGRGRGDAAGAGGGEAGNVLPSRAGGRRRSRAEAAAVEEESADEVPFSRASPERFQPLPGAPKIKGATGPDKRLVRIAERYAKDNGIDLRRQSEYVKADPERGARIAQAYEAMPHAPQDPRVAAAYQELIRQTEAQYRALEAAGYRFYFDTTGSNPWDAMRELRNKQTMGVFPTDEGFGSGATEIDVSDNPLMADTGIRWPDGSLDGELRPVLANDLFRAVHDAFGHGLEGAGFRADGEENAWQAHVRLFTGDAVGAITTETRGQNSWLNFGPHGERNRTARVEDTVFADQKTGLLPEWVWTEGRVDDGPVASRASGFSAKPRQPDATSVDAYHYSGTPNLKSIDPRKAGTVAAGGERRRFGMGNFGARGGTYARANFYVREDGAPVPAAEDVVTAAGGQHLYRVQLDNLYDLRTDPRGFAEEAGANQDMLEEEISDAGFDGFVAGRQPGIDTPVAVVFDIGRKKIPVEPASEGAAFSRAPQTDTPAFRRWFGDSKVVDADGRPLVVYHGTGYSFDEFVGDHAGAGWFARNPSDADRYSTDRDQGEPQTYAAYLSIKNPLILSFDMNDGIDAAAEVIEELGLSVDRDFGWADRAWEAVNTEEFADAAADAGYDGIKVSEGGNETWNAFSPTQIKSATGNSGEFDTENPSIIASRSTQIDTPEFRRWFRDSKVVDYDGDPKVVYHGTINAEGGFDTFDRTAGRYATHARSINAIGTWFTDAPGDADVYAGAINPERMPDGAQVYPVYLSLQQPFRVSSYDSLVALWQSQAGGDERLQNGDPDAFRAALMEQGYDGIVIEGQAADAFAEEGSQYYIAFHPTQIKSATGNSGAFDPENPSIIASRTTPADAHRKRGQLFGRLAAAGYRQGSVTQPQNRTGGRFVGLKNARDGAIVALQDKMLPLRRAQQRVSADGAAVSSITLDDAMNAYRLENLMHGAVNDELKRIEQTHIKAIQDGIRKSPFTVEQFEDYLYAKAAPERNREIAKINQGMPDAGSGITTKMAGDILAGRADGVFSGERLTPEAIKLFDQLNKHARALRDLALDNMVSAGQITPKLAADLKAKYPNYVPMRGKDAELDEGRGGGSSGRGISQRAADIRRALGRGADNIPVNILGELVGDAQRSVVAKGKAKVARAFLKFALENPQPDLYTVEPVDLEWKFSEATGEAYLGVKRRGEDINETMLVMHEGNPVYIRITDPDLRDAVLNMGVEDMGRGLRIFSALNRWRSAVLTRFNPAFTPVNMVRDLQFGTVAIAAEHGAGVAARTIAAYPAAMRAAYRHEAGRRGDASKPVSQRTMADWAAEAYANGMSTGVTHVPNVVDLQRDLVESTVGVMKLAASGRPLASIKQAWLRTAGPLIDAIENANGASENAIRLAVYTTLRKDGWSIGRAAEYAKNVTINFNRKGQAGSVMNAIFLFFNAAVQGTVAVTRVLRRPGVAAYLGGLAALQGVIAAGLMDDEDDDGITPWDKIPDYVKRTSLIIPLGDEDYFAMPMPYGFNWFTYLGGRGTQRMLLGDRPTDKSVFVDLAKSLSEAFVPIPLQDGYRSLFGDQVGFAMGLASNTDDFGSPIAKSDAYSDYPAPRALEGKVTTPQVYHWAAQLLAKAGGADLEERKAPVGWLDVAPEHIEALVDYLGGGITSLANKGMRMGEQLGAGNIDGAMSMVASAPIASRLFVEGKDARAIADRYYGERGEFARHRDIVNARLEKGMPLDEAIKDRPQEYVAGMSQAKYKRSGRTKDGKRYRRGQPRVDAAGKPVIEQDRATPPGVLKDVEKRNKAIGKAITEIRGGKLTNEEIAALYDTHYRTYMATVGDAGQVKGATGKSSDIGLPEDFDAKAKAPARVRNRTIKLLQDIRAEEQRRLLRALDFERGTGQGGDVEENIFG